MIYPIEEIRNDWIDGMPVNRLAKKYRISNHTVDRIAEQNEFPNRKVIIRNKTADDALDEPIGETEFDDEEFFRSEMYSRLHVQVVLTALVDAFSKADLRIGRCPKEAREFLLSNRVHLWLASTDIDVEVLQDKVRAMISLHDSGVDQHANVKRLLLNDQTRVTQLEEVR